MFLALMQSLSHYKGIFGVFPALRTMIRRAIPKIVRPYPVEALYSKTAAITR